MYTELPIVKASATFGLDQINVASDEIWLISELKLVLISHVS
jgi:hypothetical protein